MRVMSGFFVQHTTPKHPTPRVPPSVRSTPCVLPYYTTVSYALLLQCCCTAVLLCGLCRVRASRASVTRLLTHSSTVGELVRYNFFLTGFLLVVLLLYLLQV